VAAGILSLLVGQIPAQSRRSVRNTAAEGFILNVTASRTDQKKDPIKPENLYLYENGVEQKIKSFSFDPSPSRIVLLVDNSQTLPADVEKLKKATMEFAYEIFDGDQLYVIAYDEKPEIISDWTDDAKKLEASLATFRKKGNPYLFDAINATVSDVLMPLMPGSHKTAIVIIGDGLDRGSKTQFDSVMNQLEGANITVYALKLPDRTGGAYRRDAPKAGEALTQLTEGTGGSIFDFTDPQTAAKTICDELRRNRYLLSYSPLDTSSYDARRVFLIADQGISVRTKVAQPPTVK
jgi:Ca-activated chloride channel family protein